MIYDNLSVKTYQKFLTILVAPFTTNSFRLYFFPKSIHHFWLVSLGCRTRKILLGSHLAIEVQVTSIGPALVLRNESDNLSKNRYNYANKYAKRRRQNGGLYIAVCRMKIV